MGAPGITILDVIDNFSTAAGSTRLPELPGKSLAAFGEEVRRFTSADQVPQLDQTQHPVYLGGWPSANFGTVSGDLLLSSLLYSGQVLIKDPLADWFSEEQYHNEHKMAVRPGHRNADDGRLDILHTRAFLNVVLPAIESMRPLIKAGIVVLAPSEPLFQREAPQIDVLRRQLTAQIADNREEYLAQFTPADIPVEDNLRGMFVWAGGDKDQQQRAAISSGMLHFAREYVLARSRGAVYTAPFAHEQYIARTGLSAITSPSRRVIEAIFRSTLPVFRGLTPEVIAEIHEADAFAAYRAQLHGIYQDLPRGASDTEIAAYLLDQENALLRQHLDSAERAADQGRLGRIRERLRGVRFSLLSGLAVDLVGESTAAAIGAGAAVQLAQHIKDSKEDEGAPQVVWKALVRHNRSVAQELTDVQAVAATAPGPDPWWIPDDASMTLTVSPGAILFAEPPMPSSGQTHPADAYQEGIYRSCECLSGLKFKFCCMGL